MSTQSLNVRSPLGLVVKRITSSREITIDPPENATNQSNDEITGSIPVVGSLTLDHPFDGKMATRHNFYVLFLLIRKARSILRKARPTSNHEITCSSPVVGDSLFRPCAMYFFFSSSFLEEIATSVLFLQ